MAKRFDLYYGEPGSAKSRSIIKLIEHINKNTGLKASIAVGDGSAEMYRNSGLVDAGIIRLAQFDIRDNPFTTCQRFCEGYWPVDPFDPASQLVKPTIDSLKEYGIWIFEGCAVMGQYMMGDAKGGLAQRAADGEIIGGDVNVSITDGAGQNFGGNNGAHYNLGQRHLHADIMRTKALPGMVIWTTHERMDDGERGGAFVKGASNEKVKLNEKTIGPELIGKALTSIISRDFGNTLHFTTATKRTGDGMDPVSGKTNYKDVTDYRIYTRDHYDPDGIVGFKYKAVNRAMKPELVKSFYSSPSSDPGVGLIEFYTNLDQSNKRE